MSKKTTGKNKDKARRKKRDLEQKRYIQYQNSLRESIRTFDDPVLKEVSTPLSKEDDLSFIANMKKVLASTRHGVGLSANQIGITKNVAVLRTDMEYNIFKVLINPVIVEHSDETVTGEEGCLSYPGVIRKIDRYLKIKVKYKNEQFRSVEAEFSGFAARVVQHEIDHLFGECKLAGLENDVSVAS